MITRLLHFIDLLEEIPFVLLALASTRSGPAGLPGAGRDSVSRTKTLQQGRYLESLEGLNVGSLVEISNYEVMLPH